MIDLVVSPHLDDAMLSMGARIRRGMTVATVFAEIPPAWSWPSPFDNMCGFGSSVEAVIARRKEDLNATAELGATSVWLPFLDGQYGIDRDLDQMRELLTDLFRQHAHAAVPLGLAHPDHRLVAKVCRQAASTFVGGRFVVYADLPSANLWPSHVPGAVRGWEREGWRMLPHTWPVNFDRKLAAVAHYASQHRFPELAFENLRQERGWIATYMGV